MMRVLLSTVALLGAAVAGYLSSPGVRAQEAILGQAGLTQGEKVRVVLDPDRGAQDCTVVDLRGDFLGCRNERQGIGETVFTRWYNLRLVTRIDRPTRP